MIFSWTNVIILFSTLSAAMVVLWALQLWTKDAGIADVGWSAGIGICAIVFCYWGDGYLPRRVLVAVLALLWSLRLTLHLLPARLLLLGEDGRYQMLRKRWGSKAQRNLFVYFQFQVVLVGVFAIPFWAIATDVREGLTLFDYTALGLALASLIGEGIADRQLAVFKADPSNQGQTLMTGLWRYSRHPNYFFDWLFWWTFVLVSVPRDHLWINLIPPIVLFVLLRYVTGIPHAENQALATRGNQYRTYQKVTNAFIPWFPRKATS